MPITLVKPLRLRDHAKVSWLELFFDLIFVAAVAQVADPLREHYTPGGALRFAAMFALIWWAWSGFTNFTTRFDSDDAVQRGLMVLQLFVVAAMAANARDSLDSRSSAGFAAAYAVLRLILVALYWRARQLPRAHGLATRYAAGHGAAALIWLASAIVPAPARYLLWAIALAIDLATPWVAVEHAVRLPPVAAHLPERFGLFTLILLGEAVVAVMRGMESQETWPVPAAASALLGMGLLFLLWWWYFEAVDAVAEQHVRSHADARRLHLWSYMHFPLYLGIVWMGVGVQRVVTAAARTALSDDDVLVPAAGALLAVVAMTFIRETSGRAPRTVDWGHAGASMAAAGLVLVPLAAWRPASPVVLIAALLAAIGAQVALADGRRAAVRPPA